jgi:4-hydroxy-tetrahydrodipicolinate synthase
MIQVVVALLTPYRSDGRVDPDAVQAHVEWLLDQGVDGLMPAGTTGEGPLLEDDELVALVRAVVAVAQGRALVLAHVGRPGSAATIRLAERALAEGVDALSAVVPYYYPLEDGQLFTHYRSLLDAVGGHRPVYAYTVPGRTGNDLPARLVAELAREGLAGVKDSSKSLERHREYLATGVPVLIGTDELVQSAFEEGAAGCISAIANVRPDLLVGLRDAVVAADAERGSTLQEKVRHLRSTLARESALVALKRATAAAVPGYPSQLRAPLG